MNVTLLSRSAYRSASSRFTSSPTGSRARWSLQTSPRHRYLLTTIPRGLSEENKQASSNHPSKANRKTDTSNNNTTLGWDFEALGITGRVKYFIIGVFCVLATIESTFWINVLWAKFGSAELSPRQLKVLDRLGVREWLGFDAKDDEEKEDE